MKKRKIIFLSGILCVLVITTIALLNNNKKESIVLFDEINVKYGNPIPNDIEDYIKSGDVSLIKRSTLDFKYDNIESTQIPKKGTYKVDITYEIKDKKYKKSVKVIVE